ncbi:hypothetical protein ABH927_004567 [Planotetraspora sp. GP83]
MAPGPGLAAVLDGLDVARLSGYDAVLVLQAYARLEAHVQARKAAVMAEVGLYEPSPCDMKKMPRPDKYSADEIRAALVLTRRAAEREYVFAYDLSTRLPAVHRALAVGVIDKARALFFMTGWSADSIDASDGTRDGGRDRVCTYPGCRAPASRSELDHTHQHGHGGPTTDANLGAACAHDHDLRDHGWRVIQPNPATSPGSAAPATTTRSHHHPSPNPSPNRSPRPSRPLRRPCRKTTFHCPPPGNTARCGWNHGLSPATTLRIKNRLRPVRPLRSVNGRRVNGLCPATVVQTRKRTSRPSDTWGN